MSQASSRGLVRMIGVVTVERVYICKVYVIFNGEYSKTSFLSSDLRLRLPVRSQTVLGTSITMSKVELNNVLLYDYLRSHCISKHILYYTIFLLAIHQRWHLACVHRIVFKPVLSYYYFTMLWWAVFHRELSLMRWVSSSRVRSLNRWKPCYFPWTRSSILILIVSIQLGNKEECLVAYDRIVLVSKTV